MVPSTSNSEAVAAGITRCASALENLPELRTEVHRLREQAGETALFAAALFDLERARRGDAEARTQLLEVADSLLVFWRDRSGDELADTHPALGPLWASASALMISFEVKRFKRALDACWEARLDAALLQVAIQGLQPEGNRRVEFATCLYHLELARLFVDASRAEFARRAGLIHEAYHAKEVADELVGDDPGLQHLWRELIPYLDEFFDALEEEAERQRRSEVVTTPGGGAVVRAPALPSPDLTPAQGVAQAPAVDDATMLVAPAGETTDPVAAPLAADPAPGQSSGVFDLWLSEPARAGLPPRATPMPMEAVSETPMAAEVLEAIESDTFEPRDHTLIARPPPPPANFTPAPGSIPALDITEPRVPVVRPPPPPNTTPVPQPPAAPRSDSGIIELADIIEEPEAASRPPRPSLDVDVGDYEPDEAAQTFWRHTEAALGLLPPAEAPRLDRRALSAEGRAERKKLSGWLEGVTQRFDTVPESRTFACLMRLYMAAHLKEKSLFGGVNAKRRQAFVAALELLSPEPLAAGHCAVWFELDGKETIEHLNSGLEVLTDYLQFCARQQLDPLDPQVPAQFLA